MKIKMSWLKIVLYLYSFFIKDIKRVARRNEVHNSCMIEHVEAYKVSRHAASSRPIRGLL